MKERSYLYVCILFQDHAQSHVLILSEGLCCFRKTLFESGHYAEATVLLYGCHSPHHLTELSDFTDGSYHQTNRLFTANATFYS